MRRRSTLWSPSWTHIGGDGPAQHHVVREADGTIVYEGSDRGTAVAHWYRLLLPLQEPPWVAHLRFDPCGDSWQGPLEGQMELTDA